MANRHHHKKLRAAIRLRMRETGETHQAALAVLLREMPVPSVAAHADDRLPRASFVAFTYFGNPMTIAVCEAADHAIAFVVPSARRGPSARGDFTPTPRSPLIGGWMLRDLARTTPVDPR